MRTLLEFLLAYTFKFALWCRYRVEIRGLDKLNQENLNKPGGILFLPNHPTVFVDPTLVTLAVWDKFPIRPMIVEYMYYTPIINWVMRLVDAIPIPNFNSTSNSLKRKRSERVMEEVAQGLKAGQNFLMYPAGKTKSTNYESIGGASGLHRILTETPEANIVLVRTKGLWGSSFSRAFTGQSPPIIPTILQGVKTAFKNLIFFSPRRQVIIEFEPAPADFPYNASRLVLNKYLEAWYNKPDGLTVQKEESPGDSLVMVSLSMWGEKYPQMVQTHRLSSEENIPSPEKMPEDVRKKVIAKLAEMTDNDPANITPQMNLSSDLGLDSLDTAELIIFLQDHFDISGVPVNELTTVNKLMAIASKQIVCKEEIEEEEKDISKWKRSIARSRKYLAEGKTIPEVFLNNCAQMGNFPACGDSRSGVLTYSQLRMRVLVIAEYIRHLPGDYIGILLPSSVAATVLILATQLAGKVPLMINWTIGSRHLESVVKLSDVQVILSAWSFLDRLENIDLDVIENKLVMLEDVRNQIPLSSKLKSYFLSKLSTQKILKSFNAQKLTPDHQAVLLFTSGTENMPKGVPLTHLNLLSNQKGALEAVEIFSDDIFFGILPPFHSFGFTVSSLLCVLMGIRVAYFPNPTDGKRLAENFERWGITIMCGAPTFIKGMLKAAKPLQLDTMRLCITGAEKAPPELFELIDKLGKGKILIEGYGITECSPILTFNPLGKPPRGVGRALPGVQICIVHQETLEPLPINTQGLILAKGPNIFSGYLGSNLTSPFCDINGERWYKTGDLGSLDEEGNLTISGRMKRFIKIGAEMVSLASIEDALLQIAGKKGWQTAQEGPSLAICAKEFDGDKPKIFLFTKFETNVDEINRSLKESGFSNLVKISNVTTLQEIPIMGTGKINYRALENTYINQV